MVSLTIGNTTTELTKMAYSLKSKIGGYLSDNIDRENMKLYILPKVKVAFAVEVKETLTNHRMFKVEIDGKLDISEITVNLAKLHHTIDDFLKENKVVKFLMDEDYKVLGINNDKMDYFPYKLSEREKIEANVTNSYTFLDSVQKIEDNYFIVSFDDILLTIDKYTATNYIALLVKYYIEDRFPVYDVHRLVNQRIISNAAFQLIFFHLKSILQVKTSVSYSARNGFDLMSKMNLLPHIPSTNWWIEENGLNIKTKRLIELANKKESLIDKIKGKTGKKNKEIIIKTPCIPEYFSHAFEDEDSNTMLWSDFLKEFIEFETNTKSNLEEWNYDIFVNPIIIIPDGKVGELDKDDILFLGFDGEFFYLSMDSKFSGNNLTKEEVDLKNRMVSYFQRKFGYVVNIVYEEMIEDNICTDTQLALDNFVGE